MKNTMEDSVGVKESEIRLAAYQMWEKAGRPPGRDLQFWLDAEAQLRTPTTAASGKPVAPLSPAASDSNGGHKAPSVRLAPSRPNSAKVQRKVRRF
ncbi:MAG TPA: DUF2934 domain-containing protein [Candidatus Acidoferrum sp.]|nr:DUF2934 domain-containing protein [Candidatus Acidoferrum sp.]